MNQWVKKLKPEIHQFLKKHGKRITNQIRLGLESRGFGKADDNNNNSNQADAILGSVDFSSFSTGVNDLMAPLLYQIYIEGMQDASQELSGSFVRDPKYHEYANDYATERAAELAGTGKNPKFALSDSTREMLRNDLVDMMDEGLTPAEIATQLENDYAFSETRAMTIARTETGYTWNRGAIKMYGEAGVKLVYVTDGDYDEECRAANGQIWSADYASINALSHPNCLVAGTRVAASNTQASFTRWYEGDVIVLRTASNLELTVTPNHPILSSHGWVTAGELTEGDYIVSDTSAKWHGSGSNDDEMIPVVEEVAKSFGVPFAVVPTTAEDFHGDGTDGDVCIIRTNSLLFDKTDSSVSEHGEDGLFVGADVLVDVSGSVSTIFEGDSMTDFLFPSLLSTANGIMCSFNNAGTIFGGHSLVSKFDGIRHLPSDAEFSKPFTNSAGINSVHLPDVIRRQTLSDIELEKLVVSRAIERSLPSTVSKFETSGSESTTDSVRTTTTELSKTLSGFPGEIVLVQLVNVERQFYKGHVYNLQTVQGWYVANGILTHNCTRSFAPCLEPDAQPDEY